MSGRLTQGRGAAAAWAISRWATARSPSSSAAYRFDRDLACGLLAALPELLAGFVSRRDHREARDRQTALTSS